MASTCPFWAESPIQRGSNGRSAMLASGDSPQQVIAAIALSPEAQAKTVDDDFETLLGRTPDGAGAA